MLGLACILMCGMVSSLHPQGIKQPSRSVAPGPWNNPNYHPEAGHWRNYILAPRSRILHPVSLFAAKARGGRIVGNPASLLRGGKSAVKMVSTGGRTKSPLLIFDFGKDVGGRISVRVLSASHPRPQLHLCFSESRQYMALTPQQNNDEAKYAPGCDTANVPNGWPGVPYTWDSDSHTLPLASATLPAVLTDPQIRGGFRYLTVFLDGPGSVTIGGISLSFTGAPLQRNPRDYAGYFLSSNNELNKIWYAGAYTTQLDTVMPDTLKGNISSNVAAPCWPYQKGEADHTDGKLAVANPDQEVILDGAKRDRDPFTGDMSVEVPVTYLTTHDDSAISNTLEAFVRQQLPNGFVPGNGHVCPNNTKYFSGSYDLQFVHDVYEYFLYSGDRQFLTRIYPATVKAIGWAGSAVNGTGLLSFARYAHRGGCGLYAYTSCDHLTYLNALYYETLREMSVLAKAEKDYDQAEFYAKKALKIRSVIRSKLWDASVGAYQMSLEHPNIFPQDANALAIVCGVAKPSQINSILAYLRKHEWSTYGSLTVPPGTKPAVIPAQYEPLSSWFELTARLSGDHPYGARINSGFHLMKTFWGYMLFQDPGSTFWEKMNQNGQPAIEQFTSLAHGWAAGPTVSLTTQVLGVFPTSPGYATYTVQPHPGTLRWAQGLIPTPHGSLMVHWSQRSDHRSFHLDITAPRGTSGTIEIPAAGKNVRVVMNGRTVWAHGKASATSGALNVSEHGQYVSINDLGYGRYLVTATEAKVN